MSEKKAASVMGIGVLTVLVVLLCLCLLIFSVLTLTTAQADARLAEKQAAAVATYYKADARTALLCSAWAELGKEAARSSADCLAALQKIDESAVISVEKQGEQLCCAVSVQEDARKYKSTFAYKQDGSLEIQQWCVPELPLEVIDDSLPVFGSD